MALTAAEVEALRLTYFLAGLLIGGVLGMVITLLHVFVVGPWLQSKTEPAQYISDRRLAELRDETKFK